MGSQPDSREHGLKRHATEKGSRLARYPKRFILSGYPLETGKFRHEHLLNKKPLQSAIQQRCNGFYGVLNLALAGYTS